MVKVTQSTKKRSTQRPAPVKRLNVTVKSKRYDVLLHLYDATAPVLVASGSQDGYWIVERHDGLFVCGCPAYDFRQTCSHTAAALAADTETANAARAHGRPSHLDDAEFEVWLDDMIESIGAEPPDDAEDWAGRWDNFVNA